MTTVDKVYSREERKNDGVFYTPHYLAKYLAKKVIYYIKKGKKISSIIDPACGDGILLRDFVHELVNWKNHIGIPKIYGMDKDQNAIINSTKKFNDRSFNIFKTKFINTDSLFPIVNKNSNEGWLNLKEILKIKNGFDIALCNPPWGANLNGYDQGYLINNFVLAKGQYDIFDLFVEMILENLNNNGIYGLILPDSVFSHEQAGFRKLLISQSSIHLIARLGEKLFPDINRACTIIIGEKSIIKGNHYVDCFRLTSKYKRKIISNELALEEVEKELVHQVPQSRFLNNKNYIFDIDLKTAEHTTYDKMNKSPFLLKDYIIDTRGAEISKKGIVFQCPNCKIWRPYPKNKLPKCIKCNTPINLDIVKTEKIINYQKGKGNANLKVGEDLFRFTSISKRWIDIHKEGINYKNLKIYEGNKILVRKTGVGITASMDYENAITNQVVYILKIKSTFKKRLSLEFVLAVLNSRAMTYYLIKKYGENEWKSHPYLTQTMLNNLPFPIVDFESKKSVKLIDHVTKIIKNDIMFSKEKNISKNNDIFIERIIAKSFKLNKSDYKTIFETLHSAEQLIPIKRLLNCNYKEIFKTNGI